MATDGKLQTISEKLAKVSGAMTDLRDTPAKVSLKGDFRRHCFFRHGV